MLDECMEFLEQKAKQDSKFTYEVIVVSDGSKDGTVQCAMKYCTKYTTDKFRVLELIENRGKGGAVRLVSFNDFNLVFHVNLCSISRECKAVAADSCFSLMLTVLQSSPTTRILSKASRK
jgi:Glycosyl transferase family 2